MRRAPLLAVLALLLMAAEPAQADPFAVSVNRVFNDHFDDAAYIDSQLDAVEASGIRQARTDAFWMWAEPNAPKPDGTHAYDWAMPDRVATALARHHIRWLPILDYSAPWAKSDPDYHSPPASNDDYAAYAAAFAARYGRDGSFWAAHPELDALPATSYEIWNEPNGAWFWRPEPDAARYADMYLRARAAIRASDPAATAVVGGLVADTGYVEAMYAARPELRDAVDAVGWHPYAPTAAGSIGSVRALRATLDKLGEGDVPIRATEIGWPTSGNSPITLPEADRAAALETVTDSLARSDCGVDLIVPYTWTTPERNPDDIEDWYGIRHPDGGTTPTSDAFQRVTAKYASEPPPTDATRLRICHPPDADRDGIADTDDSDDDNDGVRDSSDAFQFDPAETTDSDADGIGDNADRDDDGDGVIDPIDAFPLDPGESIDAELDGTGDNADPDDDGDGLLDADEGLRGSSTGDLDSDDDGLPDGAELRTSPTRADSDRDRIPDGLEAGVTVPVPDPPGLASGTDLRRFKPDRDPRTRTSTVRRDTDRDGLRDSREDRNRNGRRDRRETDPRKRDSDRDGVSDRRDRRPLDRRRH